MSTPLAWLNGSLVPQSELAIAIDDRGFLLGTTVSERLRTFAGRLFRLESHLDRLATSLSIVGLNDAVDRSELERSAQQLVEHNYGLLEAGSDLGLTVFVTPGPASGAMPTVGLHTEPLHFQNWVEKYRQGDTLLISKVRQIPANCWPSELKCRSRMHYFLADREAQATDPEARALLLDQEGYVNEASTANILIYSAASGLASPRRDKILPGISLDVIESLADTMHIRFVERDIWPDELKSADEVLLCSTSPCVWSVTRIDWQPIGDGRPGPFSRRLLNAWSELVGISIDGQAEAMAG